MVNICFTWDLNLQSLMGKTPHNGRDYTSPRYLLYSLDK